MFNFVSQIAIPTNSFVDCCHKALPNCNTINKDPFLAGMSRPAVDAFRVRGDECMLSPSVQEDTYKLVPEHECDDVQEV